MYLCECEYMPQDIISFGDGGNWELPDTIWELGTEQGPLEGYDFKHWAISPVSPASLSATLHFLEIPS